MLSPKALLRVACIAVLLACAALAFVACSSGARFAPTPVGVGAISADRVASNVSIVPDFSLRGEVLTARSVAIKYHGYTGTQSNTTFATSGAAKGPYPGTFVASGLWICGFAGFPPKPYWEFKESFRISSGKLSLSRAIKGGSGVLCTGILTKKTFGPTSKTVRLELYDSGTRTGSVKTNVIEKGSLTEWLH